MTAVLDALKRGMSTELWGQSFYREAAARTVSEDGRKVFQSLVEEEGRHLDYLRGQYASINQGKAYLSIQEAMALAESVDPTEIFPKAKSANQLIPDDTTDEQALQLAMNFEKKGYDLYAQAAKQAASPEEKAIWDLLAKAEDEHYAYLADTLDYLSSNGKWYFDDQELPFFEG